MIFPIIKKCPCCSKVLFIKTNGITYENNFKSLLNWTLKKKINCRKCKVEFGLFINNSNKELDKVVWMELLKCEDACSDQLTKLQKNKEKFKEKNKELKYLKILKEIEDVQNQIRLNQVKIKVRVKIQNKNMLA